MKLNELLLEAMTRGEAQTILGLSNMFDAKELKTAYGRKSREFHPDKGGDTEKMKLINQANDLLKQSVSAGNGSNSGYSAPNWEEIHAKYKDMAKHIVKDLKSKFNVSEFEKYFSTIFSEPFKSTLTTQGDNHTGYGSPSHAGIRIKFSSADNKKVFELEIHVYLPYVGQETKTFAGTDSMTSYNLSINAFGYANRKKVKMSIRDWKFDNNHRILIDPAKTFPKKKVEKVAGTAVVTTKMKRADFILAVKNEVGAERWGDNSYIFETKDGVILIHRIVMMRVATWDIRIGQRESKYQFKGDIVKGMHLENAKTLDAFLAAKNTTNAVAMKILEKNAYKDGDET